MHEPPRTHRVAVAAYVFYEEKLLLLRRLSPPQTFAPPGGRLAPGEDPLSGLHREILEETGLKVRVLGIANVWYGSIDGEQPPLLCLNFVAEAETGEVVLSHEHTEYRWITRTEIEQRIVPMLTSTGMGYRPEGMIEAFNRRRQSLSLAPMLP